jgi:general stress protein 26
MPDPTLLDDVHAAAGKVVWAYLATATGGRPRVRVVHPAWEGPTVWIATGRESAKARQIASNPEVALFWQVAPPDFVHLTVTGRARLVDDPAAKRRLWSVFDYDMSQFFKDADDPAYGLVRVDPARIELTALPAMMQGTAPRVWRPAG